MKSVLERWLIKMNNFLILSLFFVFAQCKKQSKFIDLTYAFNNATVLFPGKKSSFNVELQGETPEGVWISSNGFCTSEHASTHIDAPIHFNRNGWTLDEIPMEYLIDVPGVIIDVFDKVHKYFSNGELSLVSNYAISREAILEWEEKNGQIPPRALILVRTGWGKRWPNEGLYWGLKNPTTTTQNPNREQSNFNAFDIELNFPGFDASAAQFLTTERQILGVGIDTLSIDPGNSKLFPAHVIFAKRNIYLLENVANLHLLPPKGFRLWAVPFKIDKGTGAPTRVLAKLDEDHKDRDL